jgi:large subunit ribosomal protein L35
MPKQKTHKGMKKRFKVTATGKVKHRSVKRGHMFSGQRGKVKRQRRNDPVVDGAYAKSVIAGLLPSL